MQFAQAPPLVPQVAAVVAPVAHWAVPETSQQPPLHATVVPPITHAPLHCSVVGLHAWFIGQSVVVMQPHAPPDAMAIQEPVHGPHAAPPEPHMPVSVPGWHFPPLSQHPFGQFAGVHVFTQLPAVHVSAAEQVAQDAPPSPQVALLGAWQPCASQQPLQVLAVQGVAESPAPAASLPVSLWGRGASRPTSGAASAGCEVASTLPSRAV